MSSPTFKAAFLLIVFAMNSIVGLACSLGATINFNADHHHAVETTVPVIHIHKDGKKHVHQEKKQRHGHDNSAKHPEPNKSGASRSDEGNCCTDEVMAFQALDKDVPSPQSIVHPVSLIALVAVYYHITLLSHTDIIKDVKPFVRSHHPPIADVRIAIQSFQI